MRKYRKRVSLGLVAGALFITVPVLAQETRNYTYDALGRVTVVEITGGPVGETKADYQYDPAGNRKNVSVSGSPNGSAAGSDPGGGASAGTTVFIVVPLNGFTLLPITR